MGIFGSCGLTRLNIFATNWNIQGHLGRLREGGLGMNYTHEAKVLFNEGAYVECFAMAQKANADDQWIQYILGTCYRNGYGVTKSPTAALTWFKKSAGQGLVQLRTR